MRVVYINGRAYRPEASAVVGQGGEATVYRCSPGEVLKLFIDPNDPLLAGNLDEQEAARRRLVDHQHKLAAFPRDLPNRVVAPRALAYNQQRGGSVVGYTMHFLDGPDVLLSYADRKWREQGGIDANRAVGVFRDLHELVSQVHAVGVVIGDFNDLNVLVAPSGETYMVDADSMQFGTFLCRTFTARFVDPLLCMPNQLMLAKPHNQHSDWYAYATMLFQCLLFINPYYGGVHRPKTGKRLREASRVLNRVTVFSPDVIYPGAALPFKSLPDELLDYFTQTYEQDRRGEFPINLLGNLRWTTCTSCGIMHARPTCPACAAPGVVKEVVTIRGSVTATRQFQTTGQILFAAYQGRKLRYVYHESGAYKREGDVTVLPGNLDRELRIRIWGDKTVLGKGSRLVAFDPSGDRASYDTDRVGRLPVFDANSSHLYWVENGQVVRDSQLAPMSIGDVLSHRTLVWVGEHFGFGFFRAGSLTRGLVFDAERRGINDSVPLPPMTGNLIDVTCTFDRHLVWFMATIEQGSDLVNHCYVITDRGELLAHAEAVQGSDSWLGESIRGRLASNRQLFAATDAGIVRVGIDNNALHVEREYPDTQPFVTAHTQLFPAKEGLLAVSNREIVLLQIR